MKYYVVSALQAGKGWEVNLTTSDRDYAQDRIDTLWDHHIPATLDTRIMEVD